MSSRIAATFVLPFLLTGAAEASAADEVVPRAGISLLGVIRFPRAQTMTIRTDARRSKLTVRMAFDGRCRGGGLGEVWASRIPSRPAVRVRDGRFSAVLSGTVDNLGGVEGRSGAFRWRLSGRFTRPDAATATVTGSATVRDGGPIISRCRIASPARVRLAIRAR